MDASDGFRSAETYVQVINFDKWRHEAILSHQSSFSTKLRNIRSLPGLTASRPKLSVFYKQRHIKSSHLYGLERRRFDL